MSMTLRTIFAQILFDLFLLEEVYIRWIGKPRDGKRRETNSQQLSERRQLYDLMSLQRRVTQRYLE